MYKKVEILIENSKEKKKKDETKVGIKGKTKWGLPW